MAARSPHNLRSTAPTGWIPPTAGGVQLVQLLVAKAPGAATEDSASPVVGRRTAVGWQAPSPQPRSRVERKLPSPSPMSESRTVGGVSAGNAGGPADLERADGDGDGTNSGDSSQVATDHESDGGPSTRDESGDDESDDEDLTAAQPGAVSRETPATPESTSSSGAADARSAAAVTGGLDSPLAARIADEQRRRAAAQSTAVPRPVAPRVMTIANQKGGVGKTTTTVNVAAALAQSGLNVLVIDIDPQGNASTALGIPHHAEVPSIYDVITDDRPLAEVLQECPDVPGLWCAPATIDLAGAEIELVSLVARESRLKRAVDEHLASMSDEARFDYVLIDCPPSLGLLTVNAFVAAAEVFIPIQCEYYALEGLSQLLNNIGMIRRHLNPRLEVSTILLTMYDGRTNLSSNVADEVRSHFPDNVLRTQIPRSVRISEAPSYGQTVLTYDPSSSGALSYLEAAKELALRTAPAAATLA